MKWCGAGDAYMSSLMCSYFMFSPLHSKMFVFCVFFCSCTTLLRDLFLLYANPYTRFTGVSKDKVKRGANPSIHTFARFLMVPPGI